MPRRLHTRELHTGLVALDPVQARHAKQALRLSAGDVVELFDDAGRSADAVLVDADDGASLAARVDSVREPSSTGFAFAVAAAVPKGERADWMVEKLSELGCAAFIPLLTERSVVHPKGTGKHDRWVRLATESAKQCRRHGVMLVEAPTPLDRLLADFSPASGSGTSATGTSAAWFLDTGPTSVPIRELLRSPPPAAGRLTLLIGPEGGWSQTEVDLMLDRHLTAVGLTRTILRVETAAVAAASCVAATWGR